MCKFPIERREIKYTNKDTWSVMIYLDPMHLSIFSRELEYGKPCGSKIESTKRTVIMPINVRVLAINVRVFYKRTCFL